MGNIAQTFFYLKVHIKSKLFTDANFSMTKKKKFSPPSISEDDTFIPFQSNDTVTACASVLLPMPEVMGNIKEIHNKLLSEY